VTRLTRAERYAQVIALRSRGLLYREIAEELGVSKSCVSEIMRDPDGSALKARKNKLRRPCPTCGALMSGGNGHAKEPRHCKDCAPNVNRTWTRERVIEAIQEFHSLMGRPPHAPDFNPTYARYLGHDQRAERFEAYDWPWQWTVTCLFGGWNAAIEAAGYEATPPGYYDTAEAHTHGASL
jgi:HNH endonuclease